jgi:hypothetical protein
VTCCSEVSLSCDEIIAFDNQSWMSIHCYAVENWMRVSILMNLYMITKGGVFDKLTIMLDSLTTF